MANSSTDKWRLVTFGECMIRLAPQPGESFLTGDRPSALTNTLLSTGGDEHNVAIALSRIGRDTTFVSILPTGPIGDIILRTGRQAGVDQTNVKLVDKEDVGLYFTIAEEKRVQYQRGNSAWAKQKVGEFDWKTIFKARNANDKIWLHCTGITPMTGEVPARNWGEALDVAASLGIPISMDFNHRPGLGPLPRLWDFTKPHLKQIKVIILSHDSLNGLAGLEGIQVKENWRDTLSDLQKKFDGPALALCSKSRSQDNVQDRFSVIFDGKTLTSSEASPVVHQPRDELGGGSAWAAGFIDASMEALEKKETVNEATRLRRADLLAALCQETIGDHSIVPRKLLSAIEAKFKGARAPLIDEDLDELHIKIKPKKDKKKDKKDKKEKDKKGSDSESDSASAKKDKKKKKEKDHDGDEGKKKNKDKKKKKSSDSDESGSESDGGKKDKKQQKDKQKKKKKNDSDSESASEKSEKKDKKDKKNAKEKKSQEDVDPNGHLSAEVRAKMEKTVARIKAAKVIAILRAKNSDLAIKRGLELVQMGCQVLEVTLDTPDVARVVAELRKQISEDKCIIGVGTVTTKAQVAQVAGWGVPFALSPVNPKGFIRACQKHGIISIPGAASPQEFWNAHIEGALLVKIFPSNLWTPEAIKAILGVGPIGKISLVATGSIAPEKVPEWITAGCVAVAMGSNLAGQDIKYAEADLAFAQAHKDWEDGGKKRAGDLFQKYKASA